ncbi:MAG: hypothetical protein Aurels2KO_27370 [Aureliella sp.]
MAALFAAWSIGPAVAQEAATLEAPAEAATDAVEQAKKPSESAKKPEPGKKQKAPEFMRVLEDDGKPKALQTAVATYKLSGAGPDDDVEVTLIGAVHIGEATYYSRLNQLFRKYDALLYEMVMDPEGGMPDPEERGVSPVSTIQVGMKSALNLAFQLDEIDYKAKNFVHADMTPQEFFDCMKELEQGLMSMIFRSMGASLAQQSSQKSNDLEVLAAMVSGDTMSLRVAFAEQMEQADGQMAALANKEGKSALITERNATAFKVLKRELDAGKKKIAVFYGAGHLKDMHKRLEKDFAMELTEMEWLDAWSLQ